MIASSRKSGQASAAPPWEALARPHIFGWGTAGISLMAILSGSGCDFEDWVGFALIAATALLPGFLWCRRLVHGIPIYPIFTLGTIWTFALPLISRHPLVVQYQPIERLSAAGMVSLVNLVGAACWYLPARRISPPPRVYRGFKPGSGDLLFFTALLVALAFNVITNAFSFDLDPSLFSLVRAIILAWANLGIFFLGYRAGRRQISPRKIRSYIVLIVALILSTLPTTMMVNGLSNGALALIGFALGRGKIPWLAVALFAGSALFLQAGKKAIREKYWNVESGATVPLARYPDFLTDWMTFSTHQLFSGDESVAGMSESEDPAPQSFMERASLMHLFLQIQRMTPEEVPYLHGQTYTIIPRLLVPRLFDAQKARTHVGTYMLAIHYHLQSTEDTYTTTIGFGLINEALANFGYAGCVGLAVFLGGFYGWAGWWSSSYPLLSQRALFTVLILTVAFENEFTAGVYVTVLFQGSCALLLLSALTMRRITVPMSAWTEVERTTFHPPDKTRALALSLEMAGPARG